MQLKSAMSANVRIVLLVCLLAVPTPAAVQAQTEPQNPAQEGGNAPAIFFETRNHDFGTAQPDTPLTHSFIFKNKGDAALLIKNVKAG